MIKILSIGKMDIDESSGNDTEEDAPYLRDPRDDEDTKTNADAGADDADDDVDSDDGLRRVQQAAQTWRVLW